MSGVAGRSGRKTRSDESKRLRILDKAWDIVEQELDNPKLSMRAKLEVAVKLVVRNIPVQVEGDGLPTVKVFIQNIIQKAGVDDKSETTNRCNRESTH